MSLLPNESQVNPSSAFWAPGVASGGGGGGGSGPDLSVSTITFNNQTQLVDFSFTTNDGVQNPGVLVGSSIDANARTFYAGTLALQGLGNATGETYATLTGGSAGDPFGAGPTTLIADCRGLYIEDSSGTNKGALYCSSIFCSSINNAAPGGGGSFNPNPQFSTLTSAGAANFLGGVTMSNTTLQFSQTNQNAAVAYYNASNGNLYLTSPSTLVVAIGTQSNAENIRVGNSNVTINSVLLATNQGVTFSSLTVSTITTQSFVPASNVVTAWLETPGNQITIQQSNSLGASAVFGWPTATQVNLGMIAANATDGMSFVCDNGAAYISGGGGHFSLSNVSSINGNAPALTSYSQQDVGALFSTLFAANPGLSTINY